LRPPANRLDWVGYGHLAHPTFRWPAAVRRGGGHLQIPKAIASGSNIQTLDDRRAAIHLDDGSTKVFRLSVQHHLTLGPPKADCGITRTWRWRSGRAGDVDELEMRAHGFALRRRQGRHRLRPVQNVAQRNRRLTRRFTQEMIPFIGPQVDVMAPMWAPMSRPWLGSWTLLDARSSTVPSIVTGKPVGLGGSLGGARPPAGRRVSHQSRGRCHGIDSASVRRSSRFRQRRLSGHVFPGALWREDHCG